MTASSSPSFAPSPPCSRCGAPLPPASTTCPSCKNANVPQPPAAQNSLAPADGRLSPGERFSAMAIDVLLGLLTGGIGWAVWTALLWRNRQTPGKRLRDHILIDQRTGQPAKVWQFVVRELFTALMFVYLGLGLVLGFGLLIDVGGFWVNTFVIPIALVSVIIFDLVWLLLSPRRRLIDVILRTNVVAGNGASYASLPKVATS